MRRRRGGRLEDRELADEARTAAAGRRPSGADDEQRPEHGGLRDRRRERSKPSPPRCAAIRSPSRNSAGSDERRVNEVVERGAQARASRTRRRAISSVPTEASVR